MLNEPRYARGLRSSPFGYCIEECKTKVPEQVLERFCASSALKGMDRSELLRRPIVTHTHGAIAAQSEVEPTVAGRGDDEPATVTLTMTARMRDQLSGLAMMTGHEDPSEYLEHLAAVHLYGEQEGDHVLASMNSMADAS